MDDLVPALDRLDYLYFTIDSSLNPFDPIAQDKERYNPEKESLRKKFEANFARVITRAVRESIAMGQQGIDSALAEKIIAILPRGYEVNKVWLMTGDGPIHPGDALPAVPELNYEETTDAKGIEVLLETILKRQELLEVMIREIKSILMRKS